MSSRPTNASSDPAIYLVAVDETSSAAHVLEVACDLGGALGGAAELHVLHVLAALPYAAAIGMVPPVVMPAEPAELTEVGKRILDRMTVDAGARFKGKIVGHLAVGEASHEILQLASSLRADLVIVGTAGRTGLARIALGSVAETVVRLAGCPVLVVRQKDYHAAPVEGIEPPCADCVAVQVQSARAKLWCERHSAHHPQGRLHYELPPTFGLGSMNFRP